MKVGGLCLVVLWVLIASGQIETWASAQRLWLHAARTSPRLARPALQVAASATNDPVVALAWLITAGHRLSTSPRVDDARVAVRDQLHLLTALGSLGCGHPDAQPYC